MKREDIDVMDAKARAALEEMPEDVRAARWEVDVFCRDVSASNPDSEDIQRWDLVKPVHGGVKTSTLEHIAASDPHAVLALIAELRRVEQERDALKSDISEAWDAVNMEDVVRDAWRTRAQEAEAKLAALQAKTDT